MSMFDLNYWAVLLAALSSFMLGGAWYSPWLFGRPWMEGCGLTEVDLQQSDPKLIYGVAFLLALFAAFFMSVLLGQDPLLTDAIVLGVLVGGGLVTTALGISYIFEQRPLKLFLINGGYYTCQFVLMGAVLSITG
ncbi:MULTISPECIES: DUF1761 domain-containing protein [Pseudoalteromonas]|uniref:DUF1761 domain-containing protein n=1 Tax=Pseudoalteromonas amylolytica TaxID=1859457 RepID=A0A1S1N184_9GAMM|nr:MULTISPECIES: DUF1761 domain-containing protein [Pseudoalteromonas]MCF6434281.1 DUF1761 domain-containing protein [Pseudoalteromonas sp. MMG022]OHU85328.1 hypothetical protein BFC16_18390 [Pseudoalteromonas sp. JW3]OHU93050.1 hypothetical protein BET10_03325 [Pseudoalteromonas amylolytica]